MGTDYSIKATVAKQRNGSWKWSQRKFWTYSFANTPLNAAHAPLAIAKMIHWDLRLVLDRSISLSATGRIGDLGDEEASMVLYDGVEGESRCLRSRRRVRGLFMIVPRCVTQRLPQG